MNTSLIIINTIIFISKLVSRQSEDWICDAPNLNLIIYLLLTETVAAKLYAIMHVYTVRVQRVHNKALQESVILSLVQFIAIVLFECNESEDYGPAKTLMNMAFTFYHEGTVAPTPVNS